jgi:glucan phosphoethanolaminetransferase (alkaline phosphatase superfamily)
LKNVFINILLKWRPPMPVLILLLFWMAQAMVAIGYILYEYGGSRLGLIMHLAVLCLFIVIILLPFTLKLINVVPLFIRRIFLALILSSANCALFFFYALTIIGYHSWCGPITLELFQTYIGQLDVLLSSYGLSVPITVALTALIWITTSTGYFYFSGYLLKALSSVVNDAKQPYFDWRIFALCSTGLMVSFYTFSYQSWTLREPLHIAWLNGHGFLRQAPRGLFLNQRSTGAAAFTVPIRNIKPRPFILITVDSLRSDQMGVYGAPVDNTPFLSGLWRKGQLHRFDTTYSICTTSSCGMVGTLSSRYWHQLNEPPLNLADVLKQYGYQVSFLLSGDNSNFFGLRRIFGPNIDLFCDGSIEKQKYVNDDSNVLNWLRKINWQSANHTFLYIHLMSVHNTGLHDSRFEKWLPVKEWNLLKLSKTPRSYRNNYNNGILQADNIIEQIFRILAEQKILENALVIISADHGEYLGELDRFGHGYPPYEPMVRIPLLVYDRLKHEYPQRSISSQVDIAPTMLHAIGAAIPADWSGIPLQLSTSRNHVYVASHDISGVVTDFNGQRFKYMRNGKDGNEELFDINDVGAESFNLAEKPEMEQTLAVMRRLNNFTNNVHSQ